MAQRRHQHVGALIQLLFRLLVSPKLFLSLGSLGSRSYRKHSNGEPAMMPMPHMSQPASNYPSNGARLVSTSGRELPLVATAVRVDARGGVARVVLEQKFRNVHAEPLTVTYSLPLPEDGAVSGFSFRIGDTLVVGEIDRKKQARERYEQAILEGRSAAILEQDRSSLFTQEVGNIPPGADVLVEIHVDQKLRWLDEGMWEWRFPTVVAPRYLGAPGRVADAQRVTQDVADGPIAARTNFTCLIRDAITEGRRAESPSHRIRTTDEHAYVEAATRVELDAAGAKLDRDIVVRWPVAKQKVGVSLDLARPTSDRAIARSTYGLLTIVPPDRSTKVRPVARDLIVLLDTSGSMGGTPLEQARRVVKAMINTMGERDRLEMIEFSWSARNWKNQAVAMNTAGKREAFKWLDSLVANGSTEMRQGIYAALNPLRSDAQRQVVLITDGLIGFESEVVATIRDRLPASSRLHTVGVGSGVNRSLTGPAARAGRGVEVVIGLDEDPERAVTRIVARTDCPVLVDLELSGDALEAHAPRHLPDLFAASPTLIAVKLKPSGGELRVRGRTVDGSWEQRIQVEPTREGSGNAAVTALFGRESVEDIETAIAGGVNVYDADRQIEQLGLDFQISTRLTSWVAVSREVMVDPRDASRRERMPHELPHGMSAEGLGLRGANDELSAALGGEVDEEEEEQADESGYDARKPEAKGESGVLFSLKELVNLEEDRIAKEANVQSVDNKKADRATVREEAANMPRRAVPAASTAAPPAYAPPPAPARPAVAPGSPAAYGPPPAPPPAPMAGAAPPKAEPSPSEPEAPQGFFSKILDAKPSPAKQKIDLKSRLKKAESVSDAPAAAPMPPPAPVLAPPFAQGAAGGGAPNQPSDPYGAVPPMAAPIALDEVSQSASDKSAEKTIGVVERIKRFFGFGESDDTTTTPSTIYLKGRLVLKNDSTFVVEASINDSFVWSEADTVTVTWSDGSISVLRVDLMKTTRSATLKTGQQLRLALTLDQANAAKTANKIVLYSGTLELVIELA